MDTPKQRNLHFIIPKPVHEVKKQLAGYEKRDFTGNIEIKFSQSETNINEWRVAIRQSESSPFGKRSSGLTWFTRFSGYIRYHTVDSTEFEGQLNIPEFYDDHFITNVLTRSFSILLFLALGGFFLSLIPANPTLLTVIGIAVSILVFILIAPYMKRSSAISARESAFRKYEDILSIIRELAPDDVII